MTPIGQQALALAQWAWEDPAGRVQTAIEQVRGMASTAEGQELREIQDVGVSLSRLAGTLDTEPVVGEDTLIGQLAGDTMTGQLIEMAHDSWVHERRGPGGKWIGSGGAATAVRPGSRAGYRPPQEPVTSRSRQARIKRMQEAQMRRIAREEAVKATQEEEQRIPAAIAAKIPADIAPENKAAEVAFQVSGKAVPTKREQLIHQQLIQTQIDPLVQNKAQAAVAEAQKLVADKLAAAHAAHETEEGRKRAKKLAIEAGGAVAGFIAAYIESRFGVPDLIALLTSALPFIIQPIVEFIKKV